MKKELKAEWALCSMDMQYATEKALMDFAKGKVSEKEAVKRVKDSMNHALLCIKDAKK